MKNFIISILFLGGLSLSAQSVVQGTIGSTGTSILDSENGLTLNFTLGQPFGTGNSEDSDIVIIQGLQGASITVVEGPSEDPNDGPSGINDYSQLDADIYFNAQTGQLVLSTKEDESINGTVFLANLNGKILSQSRIENGTVLFEKLNTTARGMYILSVITEDKERLSKKLIF